MASEFRVYVVVAGSAGVGKSVLVRHLQTGEAPTDRAPALPATVGADFVSVHRTLRLSGRVVDVHVQLIDVPGSDTFAPVLPIFYRGVEGALLVYDIGDRASFRAAGAQWAAGLQAHAASLRVLYLIGNKSDRVVDVDVDVDGGSGSARDPRKFVLRQEGVELARAIGAAAFFEVSALHWSAEDLTQPLDQLLAAVIAARPAGVRVAGSGSSSGSGGTLRLGTAAAPVAASPGGGGTCCSSATTTA